MKSKPINSHCPWSGDPVSLDSTIEYRGHTVAFCNPGCRDKFAAAMKMFDDAINQAREPVLEATELAEYKPRAMRFDSILNIGDAQLKLYHITSELNAPIEAATGDKAVAFAKENLPKKIENAGGSHDVGYVILHRGQTDHWLLMHWWGGGDITLSSLARQKGGETEFKLMDDTRLNSCVWEQVVIAHERDAWVRTAMTNEPNISAYLADRLADGLY